MGPIVYILGALMTTIGAFIRIALVFWKVIMLVRLAWALLMAGLLISGVGWVVVAIVAIVAALVLLYTRVGWVREAINAAFDWIVKAGEATASWIKGAAEAVIKFLRPIFPIIGKIASTWLKVWLTVGKVVFNVVKTITQIVASVISWIVRNWDLLAGILILPFALYLEFMKTIFMLVTFPLRKVIGWIISNWRPIFEILSAPFRLAIKVIRAVLNVLLGAVRLTVRGITGVWRVVSGVLSGPVKLGVRIATTIFRGLIKVAETVLSGLKKVWDGLVGIFTRLKAKIAGPAGAMFDVLTSAAKSAINAIITAWNSLDVRISLKIPSWVPKFGGDSFGVNDVFPDIPTLAKGGMFSDMALVGEAGPELAINRPGGVEVIPLTGPGASAASDVGEIKPSDVIMDGQKVGKVLWRRERAERARRG
jgi:phage-related protein